jgi:hypothetical protein
MRRDRRAWRWCGRALLEGREPDEVGGGMVEDVQLSGYQITPRNSRIGKKPVRPISSARCN